MRIKTNRKHDFALTTCVLVIIFQKIQPLEFSVVLCWKRGGYKWGLMAYNARNNGLFAKIVIYSESAFENLKVS